jgi:hypothetical protein
MNNNFKLYIKYILFNTNFFFIKYLVRADKNTKVNIVQANFYYLSLHFKLSTLFYSLQLSDLFVYELPINTSASTLSSSGTIATRPSNITLVYNFHSLFFQQRLFIFVAANASRIYNKNFVGAQQILSITELFLNAN